ncbi:MAG: serine/threonine protein kinase [Acidimicrobiia bacterium]|nr:serine/threonine protein kinase [Acidimicrobiia bacterium]
MDRVLNDRYELRQHAARGGMADVYHGWDRRLSREVAIKILRPELSADDEYVDRFRDEARTAARLTHPNIVSVYDTGSDEGDAYMVMEWVDGPTLAQVIRADAPLPVERACRIGADIAAGLQYAHENGVTNRDVKPSNVLLSPTGHAKVTDFGIAKVPEQSTVETLPGVVLGTPAYLAPEQLTGRPADNRSDVYGLGTVLYEMVTGRKPFLGDTPAEVAGNALHGRPARPSAINPNVPESFERILSKALARDPDGRYQSAAELRADLLELAAGGIPAAVDDPTVAMLAGADSTRAMTTIEPLPVAPPPPRRRRTVEAWLIGAVLALAILAVIVALLASNHNGGPSTTTLPPTSATSTTLPPTTTFHRTTVTHRETLPATEPQTTPQTQTTPTSVTPTTIPSITSPTS